MSNIRLRPSSKRSPKSALHSIFVRYEQTAMLLVAALGLTAILMNFDFNFIEAALYDLRVTGTVAPKTNPGIVLITLDDASTKSLNESAPLPLDQHALLLENLEKYEPRAIGYLVNMNQVHQINPELFQSRWAARFVESANRLQARGTSVLLGTPFDVTGEVVPPYPLSSVPHAIALIHKDGNVFANDKVTRRALVTLNEKPVFHFELARRMGALSPGQFPRGTYSVPEIDAKYFFFRYRGNTALSPKHHLALPYARVSFSEVLRGSVPAESMRGKIILVGTLFRDSSADFVLTPYAKAPFSNPKLVIHATILDSILSGDGALRTPNWLNAIITFLAVATVLFAVLRLTPLYSLITTVAISIGFLLFGLLAFQTEGWWIHESQPLIGVLLAFYLSVPYRLIREYKKRWEYQQKSEIVTQVEELKTNFLSLVTHDLKTPVARIQGLAEVLLSKAADRLVDRDKETLHHIIRSTEELNRFISSILELSKVESRQLPLKIESKDINQLIERCADGFKAPARARQTRIQLVLEPLFPIRIDATLITKVVNNLIDNALKYSPRGADLHIESREIEQWVEISVRDQGVGMNAQELSQLFTRFYRAKNERTAESGGTGLGLYLSKYFVEAHGGSLEVESEPGIGSTFRIRLPVEGAVLPSAAFEAADPQNVTETV